MDLLRGKRQFDRRLFWLVALLEMILTACTPVLKTISDPNLEVSGAVKSPNLSYATSQGKLGTVNAPLTITPSFLNNDGSNTIVSCVIKPGSPNAGLFPPSLSIDPTTCVISGTPSASLASTEFTITATNQRGLSTDSTITIFVSACDAISTAFDGFGGGAGTSGNPYQVCSVTHLNNINTSTTTLSKYYRLEYDLDLSISTISPIGNTATPFTGDFNGNSHTISNLNMNLPTTDNVGLFGSVNTTKSIQNLTLVNVNVRGQSGVGGLVGAAGNGYDLKVNAVSVSGTVNGTGSWVGGVGGNIDSTTLTHCTSEATVTGALDNVGGLIGMATRTTIKNSHATGNVTASSSNAGGLVGHILYSWTVEKSYAIGRVQGTFNVGGFAGRVNGNHSSTITDCYSTGNVVATASGGAGGFAGTVLSSPQFLTRDYAAGSVTSPGVYVAGLVGNCSTVTCDTTIITDSYWNTETTGQIHVTNNIDATSTVGGKTTLELQTQSTFIGWDFSSIWFSPIPGSLYPLLR